MVLAAALDLLPARVHQSFELPAHVLTTSAPVRDQVWESANYVRTDSDFFPSLIKE
jgi:hypothetical protein